MHNNADSDVVRRCLVLPGRLLGELCLSCQLTDDEIKAVAKTAHIQPVNNASLCVPTYSL